MRLPRLTTRRLMVLVAVVAVMAAVAVECERRRARFHKLAVYYSRQLLRSSIFSYSGPGGEHKTKLWEAHLSQTARHVAYFAMMRQKYLRAARYPWLPVPPDPTPPK